MVREGRAKYRGGEEVVAASGVCKTCGVRVWRKQGNSFLYCTSTKPYCNTHTYAHSMNMRCRRKTDLPSKTNITVSCQFISFCASHLDLPLSCSRYVHSASASARKAFRTGGPPPNEHANEPSTVCARPSSPVVSHYRPTFQKALLHSTYYCTYYCSLQYTVMASPL